MVFRWCPFVNVGAESLSRRENLTSRYSCSGSPDHNRIKRNGKSNESNEFRLDWIPLSPAQIHRNPYCMPVQVHQSRIEFRTAVSQREQEEAAHGNELCISISFPLPGVLRNAGTRASEHHEGLHRHSMPAQQLRSHRASYQQEMKERWSNEKSHSGNNLTASESRTTQLLSWQPAGQAGQLSQTTPVMPAESIELQLQMQGYNNNYRRINNSVPAAATTATTPAVTQSPTAAAGDDKTWL